MIPEGDDPVDEQKNWRMTRMFLFLVFGSWARLNYYLF